MRIDGIVVREGWLKFFLTGFPSPWRWLRRASLRRQFSTLTSTERMICEVGQIDPESLIRRGLL